MGLGASHLLIILVIVLVVFGAGKLPNVMKDLGQGVKSFKDALSGDKDPPEDLAKANDPATPPTIEGQSKRDAS